LSFYWFFLVFLNVPASCFITAVSALHFCSYSLIIQALLLPLIFRVQAYPHVKK
jgi:hypothetical protein